MKQSNEDKNFLNMSGEYGVCSELQKRKIQCSITFGNQKAADILILKDNKYWVVEVKTTRAKTVATNFFQNYHSRTQTPRPDFWIVVHIDNDTHVSDFYILTHEEMAHQQMIVNQMTEWTAIKGFDKVTISQLATYKNKWDTIVSSF